LYASIAFLFAANQSFDSIRAMRCAINGGSKLFASYTRHASNDFLSEIIAAQLGKEGETPSVASFPFVPQAAAETVPVSAPFGLDGAVAFSSWRERP
jgi:hypothetical protein